MKIFKKWDLWYWIAVIVYLWVYSQKEINTPEYGWMGLGIFTILLGSIFIYVIVLKILFQIIIGGIYKKIKNRHN